MTHQSTGHAGAHLFPSPPLPTQWLLAALALLATTTILITRSRRRRHAGRAATLAGGRELAPLRVHGPQPGRVILGVHGRRTLAAERRASTLVIGPSQSGKTSGLVVPALLEWEGPVLATSVKSDLLRDTHKARAAKGEVRVFDPTGSTKFEHAAWSPVAASTTWEGARRTAARLLSIGEHTDGRSVDEAFWRPAGARYLAPLLFAAAQGDLAMRDVLGWIATFDQQEPTDLLHDCHKRGARPALEALVSVWRSDERFRSSLTQTVATALDAWQEPLIANATIAESQITTHWLLSGTNTVYLVAQADDQRRLRGMFCALLADILAGAFHQATRTGEPVDPPLLLALDEAANITPLPNLDEVASTGPGQGVQLLTVLQNLSQAADRWGQDRAETIIANHRARLYCTGIGDRATLEHLRITLGEEEITRTSTTRQGPLSSVSRTVSGEYRTLAAPHRVRQANSDTALLIYGQLPPAWIRLRPWYRDQELQAIATGHRIPVRQRRRLSWAQRLSRNTGRSVAQ